MVVTVQELKPALASQDGQECCVKQVYAAFLQTSSFTLNIICYSMFNNKISCFIIHRLFRLVQTACTKLHCVCWILESVRLSIGAWFSSVEGWLAVWPVVPLRTWRHHHFNPYHCSMLTSCWLWWSWYSHKWSTHSLQYNLQLCSDLHLWCRLHKIGIKQ